MSVGICDDAIIEFTVLSTDIESSNDFLRWRIGVAPMVHFNVTKGDTREMESIYLLCWNLECPTEWVQ